MKMIYYLFFGFMLMNPLGAQPTIGPKQNVVVEKAIELEPPSSSNQQSEQFVVAHWDENSVIPEQAIEIEHDPAHHQIISKNPGKKLIAIPLKDVQDDHQVLTDNEGKTIVASVNSNEDLMTAESIVFRPLFAYRRKLSQRRRAYIPYNYVSQY